MATLRDYIDEVRRNNAGIGGPVSALPQKKQAGGPRSLADYVREVRAGPAGESLYAQYAQPKGPAQHAGSSLYSQPVREEQPGLYAQAAQNAARDASGLLGDVYAAAEERAGLPENSPYAAILGRGDYARRAKAGESRLGLGAETDRRYDYINDINGFRTRADEQAVMTDDAQRLGKYGLMTDDEIGVYNYLYSTQGREAADRYLDELEPELNKQYYTGLKNSTMDDIGDSAFDQGMYSGLTVLQQPVRSARSALASAEDAYRTATGQGIDPYSELRQISRLTQDIRGEIAGNIERAGADAGHETLGKVGSFAYQTAMSAGDSAMNAVMAKGLAGMTGAEGDTLMKATNVLGSLTMSSEVMSLAVAENKEKGYSDAGALSLGFIRGAVEYASEAMGGEWVIKNIKKNPMSFVKSMVLNMLPEGAEEVMSDAMNGAVNLLIDQLFDTEESGWPKLIRQFKESGTPWQKKNPELAALFAVAGDEVMSFLGGALATVGSSGVQFTTNRASISRTAERLHTSSENVVELINRYGAESAGEIEALAEIFDADSAEDFTQKMADNETAKAALDAAMREQSEKENATDDKAAAVNENAQTNNGNAQAAEEGGQTAEKPDLYAVQEKAAQGLDKLTDAELQVYTEYMQQQVAMSGALPGYTEKTRNMLREGLADAQAEAQRRTEAAAATETNGTQAEQGSTRADQEGYTGGSGTKYSREQADALSQLSNDTLIAGAEAQFTMPIDRLGITKEQADELRKAGLLATETTEDGDTFEYLPDTYIYDERSRRFERQAYERAQKAAGDAGQTQGAQETQQPAGNENTPAGAEAGIEDEITVDSTEDQRYEILKNQSVSAAEVDNDLLEDVEYESLNGAQKSAAKKTLQKIARRLGINKIDLKNSKISFPFRFSNTNVGVSTQHQSEYGGSYQDFAKVLTCLSDLVDRAVLIETHNEKKTGTAKANPDLKQTYVLLGAVRDGETIIPVQMEVKEFYKNDGGLYMTVALTKVNGSEVISDPTPGRAGAADHLFSDPTYSIRKIIESVKAQDGRFLKYAPDGFLNEEQKAAKRKALKKQAEEYAAYTVDGAGNLTVENGGDTQSRGAAENRTAEKGSEQAESSADLSRNPKSAENGTEKRTAAETRKEIRQAENEYMEHANTGDEEYDFKAQMEKIKALRKEAEEAEAGERSIADARDDNTAKKAEDNNDPETAKENLLAFGTAGLKNDTGEYRMKLRVKRDGRYLVSVDVDGKRSQVRTFADEKDAAEWAIGYVNGVTKAREDAALDRHRSKKERAPTITEALFGQVDPKKEADRRLRNSAADAETQTLRGRIRRANDEIQALNRLEKTTGLTEQQKAHREDLQKTLEIMSNELESRKAKTAEEKKAQAERRKTERVEVTGNKPTQSVTDARAEIMNLFHTPEGVRKETGAAIEQRLKEMLENGRITEENRQALFDTLVDAGMVPKAADHTFREIRNDLNGRRIFVNEKERGDFGDNWKSVYQKAWGARIFLTKDPTDVKLDAVNQELAQVYGENLFPTDAALSDMLDNMIDLAGKGRDTQQSLKEAIAEEAHFSGVTEDQIYQEMFDGLNEQLRTFGKKAGLEVMLKNKAASDAATERKRWEERQERKAQERRESKIREKVLHGLQRLEKLRGKAAPDVRAQVDEVLKDIDTQARSLTPYGIENLKALQEAYEEKARQEGFIDDENPGNFIRNPYVEDQLKRLSDKHLNEMDIADVIELGRTVAALENTIRTANQMIGDEFDATVKETAEGVDREVKASKGAKAGFLQKWFKEEQLSPRRFLDMLGGWKDGTMKKLSTSLENGQTRMLDFQRRAVQSFDPFMSKKENREWLKTASGKKAAWSSYGVVNGMAMDGSGYTGQSIEITPMMKIALYLHSLNEDNLRHIQTGGIVVPNKALYQKGKIQEAYVQGRRVKMQPEAVRAIASTLTAQEKTFAGYLQKFFNEQSKAAINEVSMQLDGFERAGVDNYFPIETDASFNKSDVAGEAKTQTVEGIGSIANERVHAGNPIRLCDASDVLMRQIDKVSRYYGYAIPIRNFQAVNNYVFHEEGNAYAGSIKDTINRKWGSGAGQYITKMLTDLQSGGSSRSDAMGRALSGLRSNLAGATLTLNPSVAVSQAASYPGAAQVVGWDGLAAGLTGKVDEKLIEKYTPLLWYRSQGYSTQELGDAKSAANQNLAQKALSNNWLNWIQGMDRLTVKRLWAAAEYRVRKDTGMKPGSKAQIDAGTDPYYKAVAEVFNRAVYDTQPNYTNMERAQILRSDSDLTKFLTMYKTVPLQYYGMMTEAAGRLQAARNGTAQEKAAARKYAADTFGGLMAANTVYAAIKALFKGFRKKDDAYRDDEGELTAESVSKQLGKDLLEIYAGSVIGGAEAYSAAQYLFKGGRYNAPELNIMSYGEDFIKGLRSVYSALDDDDPRKAAKAVKDAALTISQGMGLPLKNVETYLMAGIRWVRPDLALEYDNTFGGLDKSDLRGMDAETTGMATNIILRNRTGEILDRSVTDELARLYREGYREAVPTAIPDSFTYGGTTVEIKDRKAYSETWGGIVGNNLEELLGSDEYADADDKARKSMIDRLYDYATVQARKGAAPDYSVAGNSTYGWTEKADEALKAGIILTTSICAMTELNGMFADKDENGKSITGSRKEKVVEYIDALDLTDEQKDFVYLNFGGYTESSIQYTPWHGYNGAYRKTSTGGRRGGRRSSGRSGGRKASKETKAAAVPTVKKSSSGVDISRLFGGVPKTDANGADASKRLLEIIDKHYGGDAFAAAMDGGRKARTKVDFKL